MAIVDWEGFDRETANLGIFSSTYLVNISNDGTGYDNYGRSLYTTIGYARRHASFPDKSTLFMQLHIMLENMAPSPAIFGLLDGSNYQISVQIGSDGVPRIYRGNSTLLATATESLRANVWYFMQLRVSIASSGGTAELRMQGRTIATYSGNTQATANSTANGWSLEHSYQSTSWKVYFDNLLIYDTIGDPPNDWTPDTRIFDTLPSGAGSTTQWTPSAGANWQCVNEQPSNGDTNYVSAATAGLTDTYAVPAVAAPGSIIYAVGVHATARKDDAGANEIDGVLHSGLLDYAHGTPMPLSTSYARQRWLWSKDPATGSPWTVDGANAAQPGIRRTT